MASQPGEASTSAATESTPLLGGNEPSGQNGQQHYEELIPTSAASAANDAQRWKRDRALYLAISRVLAAVLIITLVLVGVRLSRMPANSTGVACLTPACIHAASEYLYGLSPDYQKLDPCTDFEELVCGGWRAHHDMRADQGSVDALSVINDDVYSIIRHILEGSYPGNSSHSAFSPRNLGTTSASVDEQNFDEMMEAYQACMDVDSITKAGMTPLVKLLDEVESTFGASSDYSETILYLEKLGVDAFYSLYVSDDAKDPEVQVIQADPINGIGLPSKEYYKDKDVVSQYRDAISQILAAIHPSKASIGSSDKAAAALVEFESKLAAASPDKVDMSDVTKTYNPMSVKDTAKLVPQVGLERVLKGLVPDDYKLDMMLTSFPDVLSNVSSIISDTPEEVVHNFLYWKVIQAFGNNVLGPEIKPWTRFQNSLAGKDPDAEAERWRTCIGHVGNSVGWILSRFFIEAAFSAAAKDFGNQIISDIKEAYLKKFEELTWMDDEVKKVAAEKVRNIDQKVGYPSASPDIMDPKDVHDYYATLNISKTYFDNVFAMNEFQVGKVWSQLGKPTDMHQWGMLASTVNAYYNPTHNEIVFPAGIMQFPLFSVDLPSYVSYGAFGAVAGHELSHAFDNNGRNYDVNGRYKDWWTNHTIAEFDKKAACIVQEFNNFTVDGKDGPIHIKGEQTLGENIADSGGISAAWSAWTDRRTKAAGANGVKGAAEPELSLPGLDYFSHEQLFFVSYASVWCSKFRPAMLTQRVLTDEHSPDMVRIKGTLANSRAFREAFSCSVKEPTCELW